MDEGGIASNRESASYGEYPLSSLVCFFLLTFYGGTVFDIETSNWGEVVTW